MEGIQPSLKPNRVAVDHDQQANSLLIVLPYIGGQAFNFLQNEAGTAVWLAGLDIDAAKVTLQDGSEEPFLLDVLAEQKTSQFLQHSMRLPGR